jgi:hypothetical protein
MERIIGAGIAKFENFRSDSLFPRHNVKIEKEFSNLLNVTISTAFPNVGMLVVKIALT